MGSLRISHAVELQLPPFIMFHLRRFAMTMRGMKKVSKFVSFPTLLNLHPFVQDGR